VKDREYYTERRVRKMHLNLEQAKKLFLTLYKDMGDQEYYNYFHYAKSREWRPDPETYFLTHLRIDGVWPIRDGIADYDEPTLFTVIEFLHDYVVKPIDTSQYGNEEAIRKARQQGKVEFRRRVNEILQRYGNGYQLGENGEIHELPSPGLSALVDSIPSTSDPDNIDRLMTHAIQKFFRYGATQDDRRDAIKALGDVMEYLKKSGVRLDLRDESALFQILNDFAIRHHNKSEQAEYNKKDFFEYVFYVLLASVTFLLKRVVRPATE